MVNALQPNQVYLYKALLCGSASILSWTSLVIDRPYNGTAGTNISVTGC